MAKATRRTRFSVITQFVFIAPVYDFESVDDLHVIDEREGSVGYQVFEYDYERHTFFTHGELFDTYDQARECALVASALIISSMNQQMRLSEASEKIQEEFMELPEEVKDKY